MSRARAAARAEQSGLRLSCVPGGRPNALRMRNVINAQTRTPHLLGLLGHLYKAFLDSFESNTPSFADLLQRPSGFNQSTPL